MDEGQKYKPFIGEPVQAGEPHELCDMLMREVAEQYMQGDIRKAEKFRRCAQVIRRLSAAPSAAVPESADRMAYEGAREDLLDWKRRALAAEELNRKFIRSINEDNGPTFMGEPVLYAAPHHEESQDARREQLLRLATALSAIAHTTNHCGERYTRLSPIAQQIFSEILPEVREILGPGNCAGVTTQHDDEDNEAQIVKRYRLLRDKTTWTTGEYAICILAFDGHHIVLKAPEEIDARLDAAIAAKE